MKTRLFGMIGPGRTIRRVLFIGALACSGFAGMAWGQQNVQWNSGASSGYWVDTQENRWFRSNDGWYIRRPDLPTGQWSYDATKDYNNVILNNSNQTTMTVNALGGSEFLIHELRFENSSNRTLSAIEGAYFSMGGGSSDAKIETVSGSGTGSYTINVPLTLAKTTELNPVGGNLTFGRAITNGGFDVQVWGTSSKTLTFNSAGTISGAGGFQLKQDCGVVFDVNQSYTGATTLNAGTLTLTGSGSIGSSSVITVGSGATLDVSGKTSGWTVGASQTLKGTGTVDANTSSTAGGSDGTKYTVTIAGTHAPGNSPGLQTIDGNLTYGSTSIFSWELGGNTVTQGTSPDYTYDQVSVTGALSVESGAKFNILLNSSGSTVDFTNGFWSTPQSWSVFLGKTFSGFALNSISSDTASHSYTTYGSFSISGSNLTWTPVPEPSSALAGLLLGAGLLRRRRNSEAGGQRPELRK